MGNILKFRRRALVAVLAFAAATAFAHAAPTTVTDQQEAADQKIVSDAMTDYSQNGFGAIARHIDALKGVLAHAPASYPMVERRGAQTIIHSSDSTEYLALALTAAAGAHGTTTVQRPNTYPQAALLLGSYADEMHHYNDADPWLDRGLAMQPHNWMLSLEKAASLMARQRPADAVVVLKDALAHQAYITNENRARLQRNLGVALIDAGRLDDAEKALNESIRLFPNNPGARNELTYIAKLRAGGARTNVELVTPGQTPQQPDAQAPSKN